MEEDNRAGVIDVQLHRVRVVFSDGVFSDGVRPVGFFFAVVTRLVLGMLVLFFVLFDFSVFFSRVFVLVRVVGFNAADHCEQARNRLGIDFVVEETERTETGPDDHQTDNESEVAHAVDDERLVGRIRGRLAFDVETDEQVTANSDQFPEDEHLKDVTSENQTEHRKTEQRHERKEAVEPAGAVKMTAVGKVDFVIDVVVGQFVAHVSEREDVNAGGN